MEERKLHLKEKAHRELLRILDYWMHNAVDEENGGFIGEINFKNEKNFSAEKGAVLHARILWTFSAAYDLLKDEKYLEVAQRAFDYILTHFYNEEFGGIYWSINCDGTPKDTKNQIYALAFTIYGLTEFYKITANENALKAAQNLFEKIEEHSHDKDKGGYLEASTENWADIEDLRLSEKDANEKKTMNTHLHIVEAYANLYLVWPDESVKKAIAEILRITETHFIDAESWHLKLFFNENWIEKEDVISYGHDIEAAWLLLWCAEVIDDEELIKNYKKYAVKLSDATMEGIDSDGGLWYEYEPQEERFIAEKHWWPQAELWIGMINAWQISGEEKYFSIAEKNYGFVEKYILDETHGEWIWGINEDYSPIKKAKIGFWKCPYHNSRACMELLKRL